MTETSKEIFGKDGFTGHAMEVVDTGPGAVVLTIIPIFVLPRVAQTVAILKGTAVTLSSLGV